MKRLIEEVSIEMGFNGEINDSVLHEAQRRLDMQNDVLARQTDCEFKEETMWFMAEQS